MRTRRLQKYVYKQADLIPVFRSAVKTIYQPKPIVPRMRPETHGQNVMEVCADRLPSDDDAPSTPGSEFSVRDEEIYDAYENLYVNALSNHIVYRC